MGWREAIEVTPIVVIKGANGGEFVYDAAGNLRAANVGATTKDPLQGITCQQGISTFNGHGAVIFLESTALDATFLYSDTGTATQGTLLTSQASGTGTDPFGFAFLRGVVAYNNAAAFAVQLGVGGTITFFTGPAGGGGPWTAGPSAGFNGATQFLIDAVTGGVEMDLTTHGAANIVLTAGNQIVHKSDTVIPAVSPMTFSSFSNSAAETTVASVTIPANDAIFASVYDLLVHGSIQVALATNVDFRIRVTGPGGTLLYDSGSFACTVAAGISKDWWIQAPLVFRGTGNTNVDVNGKLTENVNTTGGIAEHDGFGSFAAINNTAAVTIAVTAQFSAANAGNTCNGINGAMTRRCH